MHGRWIAKPVSSLTLDEVRLWREMDLRDLPLSQGLGWAYASEYLSGNPFLVFSPERRVSALFIQMGDLVECVNGPFLDWSLIDGPQSFNERIGMVAYSVRQALLKVERVHLRPRLTEGEYQFYQDHLAFPMSTLDRSRTLILPLQKNLDVLWRRLPARIRHEVSRARRAGGVVSARAAGEGLDSFWRGLSSFYQSRGLFLPTLEWFRAFLSHQSHAEILRAEHPGSGSRAEVLVVHGGSRSTYFYAFDHREDSCPNISLNALAQWEAIQRAAALGVGAYDFNGILIGEAKDSASFLGVDRYKRKWGGVPIDLYNPLISFDF